MKVYVRNERGQQTVRDLSFFTALKLRWSVFILFFNEDIETRPIVRFMF